MKEKQEKNVLLKSMLKIDNINSKSSNIKCSAQTGHNVSYRINIYSTDKKHTFFDPDDKHFHIIVGEANRD